MFSYPLASTETARLAALRRYEIVDTPAEPAFDDLARLAADIFRTPTALVSFVEERRQFFKARVGFDACETAREVSFCAHALMQDDVLVVPDAHQDERFKDNPLVLGSPFIRFYAGAPLVADTGEKIGSVCIIDTVARAPLTKHECGLLQQIAKLVMNQLDQRRLLLLKQASLKLASATPDAVVCLDQEGAITFWNRAAEIIFGYARAEVLGSKIDRLLPAGLPVSDLTTGAGAPGQGRFEMEGRRCDGTGIPVEFSVARWSDRETEQTGLIIRDVSEKHRARERVSYLAHHDQLTGLPNRVTVVAAIAEQLQKGRPFAVLKIALDKFRQANATLGMAAGDLLLQRAAERIAAQAGPDALVGRLGGDEFGILLPGLVDPDVASAVASTVLRAFQEPFDLHGIRLIVGASAGVTLSPGICEAQDAGEVLKSALLALQSAKAEGGSQAQVFRPALANRAHERSVLEGALRTAFERSEFELYYQPQFRLADGRLVGAEALLRWHHPEKGLLAPGSFLGALETSANVRPVGRWILETAAAFSADLMREGTPVRMGVNLFAAQLIGGDLAAMVKQVLTRHALPPALLEIEITETTVLKLDDDVVGPLRQIRDFGVGVAFDDYGTGYASLSLLKKYPLTRLKIDREFVRELETNPDDAAIVKAVLAMSRSLGLHVTAEGIERPAQADLLRAWGCDDAQGYLFGKPMPSGDFRALLREPAPVAA